MYADGEPIGFTTWRGEMQWAYDSNFFNIISQSRLAPAIPLGMGRSGKRCLCEKITATFPENGMSQLLTGVFWPIND